MRGLSGKPMGTWILSGGQGGDAVAETTQTMAGIFVITNPLRAAALSLVDM